MFYDVFHALIEFIFFSFCIFYNIEPFTWQNGSIFTTHFHYEAHIRSNPNLVHCLIKHYAFVWCCLYGKVIKLKKARNALRIVIVFLILCFDASSNQINYFCFFADWLAETVLLCSPLTNHCCRTVFGVLNRVIFLEKISRSSFGNFLWVWTWTCSELVI